MKRYVPELTACVIVLASIIPIGSFFLLLQLGVAIRNHRDDSVFGASQSTISSTSTAPIDASSNLYIAGTVEIVGSYDAENGPTYDQLITYTTPVEHELITNRDLVSYHCGGSHMLYIVKNGTGTSFYSSGQNDFGQLGIGTVDSLFYTTVLQRVDMPLSESVSVIQVSAGYAHSLVLLADGRVYGFGSNEAIELSTMFNCSICPTPAEIYFFDLQNFTGPVRKDIRHVSAGYKISLYVDGDGKAYSYQQEIKTEVMSMPALSPRSFDTDLLFSNIFAGYENVFLSSSTNDLYFAGFNLYGQGGVGHTFDVSFDDIELVSFAQSTNIVDVKIGYHHTLFLAANGKVHVSGNTSDHHQTCNEASITNVPTHIFADEESVADLCVSRYHSSFLFANGSVYHCGRNHYGLFGTGEWYTNTTGYVIESDVHTYKTPTPIENFYDVKTLCGGYRYTMYSKK